MFTTYNVDSLKGLASTLAHHPYHRQLLDGTAPWDQSKIALVQKRDHMLDTWQLRDLGITSRYRTLKERLDELAVTFVDTMTYAKIGVDLQGSHAHLHATFPVLRPGVEDALSNLGFVRPGRNILDVLEWRAEHGMDVLHCSIFGDVLHEGKVTQGFQNAYVLRNPRFDPLLRGVHPTWERVGRINRIIADCHQYRTLRQARTAARHLDAAIEDHRRLRRIEINLRLPEPHPTPVEELDEAGLDAVAAFVA